MTLVGAVMGTLGLAAPFLAADPAMAVTATGTLGVTITITSGCAVDAGPNTLDFGSALSTIGSAIDVSTSFNVTCDNATTYAVSLNGGTSGSIAARTMTQGANTVGYQLYTDAARTTVFGDGTTGSTVAGTGSGAAQPISVHGRVPAQGPVATGVYNDTVTITVTY